MSYEASFSWPTQQGIGVIKDRFDISPSTAGLYQMGPSYYSSGPDFIRLARTTESTLTLFWIHPAELPTSSD